MKVTAKKKALTTLKRVKHMSVAQEEDDSRLFLIIGSGRYTDTLQLSVSTSRFITINDIRIILTFLSRNM